MKRIVALFYIIIISIGGLFGQGLLLPIDSKGSDQMEEWSVRYPEYYVGITSSLKAYDRIDLVQVAQKIYQLDSNAFLRDINHTYFMRDNWWMLKNKDSHNAKSFSHLIPKQKKGLLGYFYRYDKSMMSYEINEDNFIELNPLLNLSFGRSSSEQIVYENTRGFSISGQLDKRIYFHSEIREVQRQLPLFADEFRQRYKVVPHAANYKPYESPILNINNGIDYNYSNGYVGFNLTKNLAATVGHGKHFIGNGIRSLLLSDFGMNYFFTRLKWSFGKIQYHNLYTVLKSRSKNDVFRDGLIPKKYMSSHYLNINVLPTLEVGIFESVVFSRNNGYELEYLNPIILYRSVESSLGSPDNILLGMNINWNLNKRYFFYGQMIIDEFKLNEFIDYKKGWWANKWGTQVGMKYLDLFNIPNLDVQIEYNVVRPYVYTHRDSVRSYAHYNQALAHPWGANFKELLVGLKYQPTSTIQLAANWINGCRGLDIEDQNNGSDILRSYYEGVSFYGNEICQGDQTDVNIMSLEASYQFYHNYNIDFQYLYRTEKTALSDIIDYHMIQLGLRINLEKYDLLF